MKRRKPLLILISRRLIVQGLPHLAPPVARLLADKACYSMSGRMNGNSQQLIYTSHIRLLLRIHHEGGGHGRPALELRAGPMRIVGKSHKERIPQSFGCRLAPFHRRLLIDGAIRDHDRQIGHDRVSRLCTLGRQPPCLAIHLVVDGNIDLLDQFRRLEGAVGLDNVFRSNKALRSLQMMTELMQNSFFS
jgi:hypothetical protein